MAREKKRRRRRPDKAGKPANGKGSEEEKEPKEKGPKEKEPREKEPKEKKRKKKPSVDVTEQAALGAEVPPETDATRVVFSMLRETADALHEKGAKRGALIVIGRFASVGEVKGARPPKTNPFEGQYLSAGDKAFQRMLLQDEALEDGAVVVDTSGQILGGRIYLLVDNPLVKVPEGCFARHIAAASTSLRKHVESVVTLSEQKNVVRVFRDGKISQTYDPAAAAQKSKRAKRKRKPDTKRTRAAKREREVGGEREATAEVGGARDGASPEAEAAPAVNAGNEAGSGEGSSTQGTEGSA